MARSSSKARRGIVSPRRWAVIVLGLILFAALLLTHGIASSDIGIDAHGRPPGPIDRVPAEILSGGPVITANSDSAHSERIPPKTVVLTFDDGPDPRWTPEILDVLRRHDVPGTFFVVGSMAAQHPDLIREIRDSGSQLGIHTFTHPDLSVISEARVDLELSETQLALAGAAGVTSYLVRPPYSATPNALDNANWASLQEIGDRGYVTVLSGIDSQDWRRPGVDAIVRNSTPRDGAGAIVLLHDAGGDRSQTVAALGRLIPELRAQGYRFTTVDEALGLPEANSPASTWDRIRGQVLLVAVGLADVVVVGLVTAIVLIGVLVVVRLLGMLVLAHRHARQRRSPGWSWGPSVTQPVSVIVPAYNEQQCIADTVRSLVASEHPLEVVVIDDGSSDDTAGIVKRLALPNVRVVRQANQGKATALNTGIALARFTLIVMMDGDTIFEPATVGRLVQPFADPAVGAVAGNAKIGNKRGLLGWWQHIEYVTGFNIDRRVYDLLRCMPTVPGAIGAFRRSALASVGGLSDDTLAEDTDLTMALCRRGWRVVYEEDALAWTEAPATLSALTRQRYRWSYGTMQSMWKHRGAIAQRGPAGRFGRFGILHLGLFQVLLPLLAPMVDVFLLYGLIFLDPLRTVMLWGGVLALHLIGAVYAFHLDREPMRPLWLLPLQQIVYRQLMYLVLIQSIFSALAGVRLGWQKLQRSGGVRTGGSTRARHRRGETDADLVAARADRAAERDTRTRKV